MTTEAMAERAPCKINQYTLSRELFEKGFPESGGPCTCTSVCCEGGVYADVKERDRILAHKEMIKKYMDETQSTDEATWFEKKESDDTDFVSGRCVGTQEINNKCVFLDKSGRCSIQVAATSEGMDRWALKPLFCVLFPIEISDGVIGFDDMLDEEEGCCSPTETFAIPLFRACKDELVYLLGEDGYAAAERYYEEHYNRANGSTQPASGVAASRT